MGSRKLGSTKRRSGRNVADDAAARIRHSNQRVKQIYAEGSRSTALEQALEVLEEAERVLEPTDPTLGESLNNVATIHDSLGDFASARPLYQRAIEILRRAPNASRQNLASVLSSLGVGLWAAGYTSDAVEVVGEAIEIRRTIFGDKSPEAENSRQTLAALYASMGDFERAEHIYPEPAYIAQSPRNASRIATILHFYGLRYESEGSYEFARSLYERAKEHAERTFGVRHPTVAASLNNAAIVEEKLGRYAEAESLYRTALEILADFDEFAADPMLGTILNNLGWLRYATGDYRSAEDLLTRALDIRRRILGKDHPDVAQTLNNLGILRFTARNLDAAETLLAEALDIINRSTVPERLARLADALNNLGRVLRADGRLDEAISAYRQALQLRTEMQGPRGAAVGESHNNLGGLLYATGHYQDALEAFDRAYQIRRDALGEEHPDVTRSLLNAVAALQALGNHEDAIGIARAVHWQLRKVLGPRHSHVALALIAEAESLAAMGSTDDALASILEAASIEDSEVNQVFAVASESERLLFAERVRQTMAAALPLVLRDEQLHDAVDRVFELVLRRKGLVTGFAVAQRAVILEGRYPDLQPLLQELTSLRQRSAQAALAGPRLGEVTTHEEMLDKLEQEREALERRLANQIPEMALEQQLGAGGANEVRAAIPTGAVLVEFVRFEPYRLGADRVSGEAPWAPARYVAFVVPSKRKPQLVDVGEADPIDAMVADFRAFVTGEPPASVAASAPGSVPADGRSLRSVVFDPLLAPIAKHTRLFIAPDGDLSRLPFEALPTDRGRLIDEYEISYLSTGRDILRPRAASGPAVPTAPLVIADPDFDLQARTASARKRARPDFGRSRELRQAADVRRHDQFERLPATRKEGKRIAEILGTVPLLGAQALDPVVRQARSPRILHLATHGFFLPDQPRTPSADVALAQPQEGLARLAEVQNPLLRSGLALAGVNAWLAGKPLDPSIEDGVLTAEDVSCMDLRGTELVVLSACETGLGSVRVGEAVFGLRRALVVAGAKSLVMSLWKVPDQATASLMEDFYRRMRSGEPPASALRAAQQSLRHRHPDPLYWAAFIYQGDPEWITP